MSEAIEAAAVINHLLAGRKKATKYISPKLVVKGTRRHKPRRGERTVEILLTVGAPNWAERRFIKLARKAGEPFPVRDVQIKEWK